MLNVKERQNKTNNNNDDNEEEEEEEEEDSRGIIQTHSIMAQSYKGWLRQQQWNKYDKSNE